MENTICDPKPLGPKLSSTRISPNPLPPLKTVAPIPRPNLISISLEILWGCNLKCTLCNVYKLKKYNMPYEKIEAILNKVPTLQRFVVIGQGEPLLHPEWFKIMALVRSLNLQLHIVTNGMVLNEEYIRAFPKNAIVQFSIDSFRPEIYKAMRPGGDVGKVLRNLQLLATLRSDIRIGIQSIITKKTYPYIDEIAKFCEEFQFSFNALYPGTGTVETFNEHYPEQQHPRKIITSPRVCQEPFSSLMIGINGEIYPCCFMYGSLNKEKPLEHHIEYMADGKLDRVCVKQYKLGNIFEDDVYKIWNEPRICGARNAIYNSLNASKSYTELKKDVDFEDETGYDYCKICALRWGKIC